MIDWYWLIPAAIAGMVIALFIIVLISMGDQ